MNPATARYLWIFLLCCLTQLAGGQVTLRGKINMKSAESAWGTKLYLSVLEDLSKGFKTIDTIDTNGDGSFYYQRPVSDSNTIYRLLLPPKKGNHRSIIEGYRDNYILLVLQDGLIYEIHADADSLYYSAQMKGNPHTGPISHLRDLKRPFAQLAIDAEKNRSVEATPEDSRGSDEKHNALLKAWESATNEYKVKLKGFMMNEDEAPLLMLGLYYYYMASFGRYEAVLYQKVLSKVKIDDYKLAKAIHDELQRPSAGRVGQQLPAITLQDENGGSVPLQSLKHDLLVIDLWASWCRPCRKANTTYLRDIQDRFEQLAKQQKRITASASAIDQKDSTLNMPMLIGVSVDENKTAWLAAIKHDGAYWLQLIDEPAGLAKHLGISTFPTYIIADGSNKIVFETNNEMELRKFLSERITIGRKDAFE